MFRKTSTPVNEAADATTSSKKTAPTIISSDIRLLGNIVSDSMVDIDGRIEGNVTAHVIYIRSNGVIMGDIMTEAEIHIFGAVHGVIKSPKVCVYESAHIEGVILHKSLSIEDGAYVDAQFKPYDSQARLSNTNTILQDAQEDETEEYDILKDLKLVT